MVRKRRDLKATQGGSTLGNRYKPDEDIYLPVKRRDGKIPPARRRASHESEPPRGDYEHEDTPTQRRLRNLQNLLVLIEAYRRQHDHREVRAVFLRYLYPKHAGVRPEGDLTAEDRVQLMKHLVRIVASELEDKPHYLKPREQRLSEAMGRLKAAEQGATQRKLAREYDVSQATLSRRVQSDSQEGSIRRMEETSPSPRDAQILRLRAAGLTFREIAKRVSCSVGTAHNVVRKEQEMIATEIVKELRRLDERAEERHHEQLMAIAKLKDGETPPEAAERILAELGDGAVHTRPLRSAAQAIPNCRQAED